MKPLALPDSVVAVIDMLDRDAFPLRSFPVTADHAAIQRYFGSRDVIDLLRSLQREHEERAMEVGLLPRD